MGGVTFDEGDPCIEGGMFAVWNDHPGNGITVKDIHHRTMPALQVIAEKKWGKPPTTYADWDARRAKLHEAPGVNVLGRLGYAGTDTEVGYPYQVEFTVQCAAESKGAILSQTDNATFYLCDPQNGLVGYEREGYLHTFNYRLPAEGTVTLMLKGDARNVSLYVNGQHRQTLAQETLYVANDASRYKFQTTDPTAILTTVHRPANQMAYVHTLVFPLQTKARNCQSKVSEFKVSQ